MEKGRCPICYHRKLNYMDGKLKGDSYEVNYVCNFKGCGFEGMELYDLVFVDHYGRDGNHPKKIRVCNGS